MPQQLEERRQEVEEIVEADAEEAAPMPPGFTPFQEVCAKFDLRCGDARLVAFGTSGIVVEAAMVGGGRITVKFDQRADGDERCVDVMPYEIVPQLPAALGLRIGEEVVAAMDLMIGDEVVVRFGAAGTLLRSAEEEGRLTVRFEGCRLNELNVQRFEIERRRKLPGGFEVAQVVAAAHDLMSNSTLLVRSGGRGVVLGFYDDARVNVMFDSRADGQSIPVNVMPSEIVAIAAVNTAA